MLVALKRKVHELEETLADHASMECLYEKQIVSLRQQVAELQVRCYTFLRALRSHATASEFIQI